MEQLVLITMVAVVMPVSVLLGLREQTVKMVHKHFALPYPVQKKYLSMYSLKASMLFLTFHMLQSTYDTFIYTHIPDSLHLLIPMLSPFSLLYCIHSDIF